MVTLEQIRLLEAQVDKALTYIDTLKDENGALRGRLVSAQKRVEDLESTVEGYRRDQGRIEEGILNALNKLNRFEDTLLTSAGTAPEREPAAVGSPAARRTEEEPEILESAEPVRPESEDAEDDSANDGRKGSGELDIF
jgi:hypothetical protein